MTARRDLITLLFFGLWIAFGLSWFVYVIGMLRFLLLGPGHFLY